MAPPLNETQIEQIYMNHIVDPSELTLALALSVIVVIVIFSTIYAICCIEVLKGNFDMIIRKTPVINIAHSFQELPMKIKQPFRKSPLDQQNIVNDDTDSEVF